MQASRPGWGWLARESASRAMWRPNRLLFEGTRAGADEARWRVRAPLAVVDGGRAKPLRMQGDNLSKPLLWPDSDRPEGPAGDY